MPHASVIPPDALLQHAEFVQRLAAGLVRDPGQQDDAVQETWLAATRHPPRGGRPARGWLATVLRRAVRRARRSESRRRHREEASARPEASAPTVDRVVREELLRRVVAAVFALDAAARETILLRFYEGLPPREIAVRTQVPVNTVKSRLRRALAALRADLTQDDPSWRAGLIGAFGLERTLPVAGGGSTGTTVGVLAMGTKLKAVGVAGALCLVGGGGWMLLAPDGEEGPRQDDRLETLLDVESGPALAGRGSERSAAARSARVGRPPGTMRTDSGMAPDPAVDDTKVRTSAYEPVGPDRATLAAHGALGHLPPGVIGGTVFRGAEPFSGGSAVVWRPADGGGPEMLPVGREPLARVPLGRDGSYRFEHLEPGAYFLGVEVPGQPPRMAARELTVGDEKTPKALTVFGTTTLLGRVYDVAGRAVAGASVRVTVISTGPTHNWNAMLQTTTDADGAYRFDELTAGGGWLSVSFTNDFDDVKATRSRQISLKRGETTRANFGTPGGTPEVTGRVLAACGEPLRGPGRLVFSDKHSTQYVESQFDAEGRYTHRIPPGEYRVTVLPAQRGGEVLNPLHVDLTVGEHHQKSSLTIPGARLHGRVATSQRGDRVVVQRVEPPRVLISAAVDADGAYVIDGLKPGAYTVHLAQRARDERVERHPVTLHPADTLRELDLPGR